MIACHHFFQRLRLRFAGGAASVGAALELAFVALGQAGCVESDPVSESTGTTAGSTGLSTSETSGLTSTELGQESTVTSESASHVGKWTDLIDSALWQPAPAELDPFPSHQSGEVGCPAGTWRLEDNTLEVDTGYCAYGLFNQTTKVAIQRGQRVRIVAWHLQLTAPAQGTGHLALTIGDNFVWETLAEIPGAPEAYDVEVEATSDIPAGTPVVFHLHNHGFNTWSILSVQVGQGQP
jgi:hypothetical protein